jgi:hypothetical protein
MDDKPTHPRVSGSGAALDQVRDGRVATAALGAGLAEGLHVAQRRGTALDRLRDRAVAHAQAVTDDRHVVGLPAKVC